MKLPLTKQIRKITGFVSIFLYPIITLAQSSEYLVLNHWAYPVIQQLYLRGNFQSLFHHSRPFTRMEIADDILGLDSKLNKTAYEKYWLNQLTVEFMPEIQKLKKELSFKSFNLEGNPQLIGSNKDNPTEKLRGIVKLSTSARFNEGASLYYQIEVDTDGFEDSDYRGWNEYPEPGGITGFTEFAYLNFSLNFMDILIGRSQFSWGPGKYSTLILSNNSPSFDMISLKGKFWRLQANTIASVLDKRKYNRDRKIEGHFPFERYMVGHRLSYKSGSLEMGVNEMIILNNRDTLDTNLGFLNPLIWIYSNEINVEVENNLLASFDISWTKNRKQVYGELLIDDVSIDRDRTQRIAATIGFSKTEPLNIQNWDTILEYTRINNWVYNHGFDIPQNSYLHFGSIIGHPLGPDTDRLMWENRYWRKDITIVNQFSVTRDGEADIFTPTPAPAGSPDTLKQDFPTGVVQNLFSNEIKLIYHPSPFWLITFSSEWLFTKNKNHIENDDVHSFQFKIDISYRWRKDWIVKKRL